MVKAEQLRETGSDEGEGRGALWEDKLPPHRPTSGEGAVTVPARRGQGLSWGRGGRQPFLGAERACPRLPPSPRAASPALIAVI